MTLRARRILASAGTGKTHTLTTALLLLVLDGVELRAILAATFTRTAAGEILERILSRLCAAATSPAKLEQLSRELDRPLTRDVCLRAAATLARDLGAVRVLTLDAFLLQVATAFSVELGLPPGWRITSEDEDARFRAMAVARVLREGGKELITSLLRMLKKSEGERSVHQSITDVLFAVTSLHAQAVQGAWQGVQPCGEVLAQPAIAALVKQLESAPLPLTAEGKPNANWHKARQKAVELVTNADWKTFVEGGLGKAARGDGHYYRIPFPEAIGDACTRLLAHARADASAALALQNLAASRLAEAFCAAYEEIKRERGGLCFDDLPRLLMNEDLEALRDELYYRLDGAVQHVLLDEFQDTSVPQFKVLEPLIAEIVSDETRPRSLLVVGDSKQSLFGWRHAEPTLLARMGDTWPQIRPEDLSRSYRSSPVILDAVNRVFGDISTNPALLDHPAAAAAAVEWQGMFSPHTFDACLERVPGKAILREYPPVPDGETAKDVLASARCEFIAARVRALLDHATAHGVNDLTVGILLRTKRSVPRLLHTLQEHGIDAAEEGGSPLTQSPAVAAVVSLLRVSDHPGDTLSAFHVATTALGAAVGLSRDASPHAARAVAGELRERLTRHGISPCVSEWAQWLMPVCSDIDRTRLVQMVEVAAEYDARGGIGIRGFLELLAVTRKPAGTPAPVRVMTIHAAKGLEFDAVVAPELDGLVPQRNPEVLYAREHPTGPITSLSLYAPDYVQEASPLLASMAHERKAKEIREALCLLYVTMTRARRYLEMVVEPKDTNAIRLSRVLRHALAAPQETPPRKASGKDKSAAVAPTPSDPAGVILWEIGSENWPVDPRPKPAEARAASETDSKSPGKTQTLPRLVISMASSSQRATVSASSLAKDEGTLFASAPQAVEHETGAGDSADADVAASSLDRSAHRRRARALGTAIHACLEHMTWIEDCLLGPPQVASILDSIDLPFDVDAGTVSSSLARVLRIDAVAGLLRRDRYAREQDTTLELHRELAAALRTKEGAITTARIDRVVIVRQGDRVISAEIIDWKTDGLSSENPSAAASTAPRAVPPQYLAQMKAYREVVARVLGLDLAKVKATLAFVATGQVVTCNS